LVLVSVDPQTADIDLRIRSSYRRVAKPTNEPTVLLPRLATEITNRCVRRNEVL
jgi:hypothetical protein